MKALRKTIRLLYSFLACLRYFFAGRNCTFLLLDTPEHGNIGDQAIALAEQQLLNEWFGPGSYYEITANQVDGFEEVLARLSPMNQVILVNGGGFLGALWPNEEYRFRCILRAFSNHKVVVFPQTVTFDRGTDEGRMFFRESAELWCDHPDLTICCREQKSWQILDGSFPEVTALLTPDVVLGLEVHVPRRQRHGVLFCMRADCERILDDPSVDSLRSAIEGVLPGETIAHTDTVVDRRVSPSRREDEVFAKLVKFASARLVVTDRLHGMVFAAITGTPCVALDNSNGKVGRVHKWIAELPYVRFCQGVPEAIEEIQGGVPDPELYPFKIYREKLESVRDLLLETMQRSSHGDAWTVGR